MILMGLGIIIVATIRFIRMSRHIDSNDVRKIGIHTDILLAGLLVLIGAGVLVYAAQLVLRVRSDQTTSIRPGLAANQHGLSTGAEPKVAGL